MANAMTQMVDALMVNPVDPAKVRAAIARGVAENDYEFKATAGQDGSHLHYACAQPHMTPEAVGLLLDAGINPRAQDAYGRLPLHVAVTRCADPRVADLLVEHGADVNAHDGNRSTPLHWATMADNEAMVAWLLAKGARANAVNLDADTPLHHAAICRNPEIAARLVEAGAALDAQDKHGRTPLHVAVIEEDARMARLLIAAGARQDIRDRDGDSPRFIAATMGMVLPSPTVTRPERRAALER